MPRRVMMRTACHGMARYRIERLGLRRGLVDRGCSHVEEEATSSACISSSFAVTPQTPSTPLIPRFRYHSGHSKPCPVVAPSAGGRPLWLNYYSETRVSRVVSRSEVSNPLSGSATLRIPSGYPQDTSLHAPLPSGYPLDTPRIPHYMQSWCPISGSRSRIRDPRSRTEPENGFDPRSRDKRGPRPCAAE